MTPATLDRARAAKQKLRRQLDGVEGLRGIGISSLDSGYAIKVNVTQPASGFRFPDDVDGVPVIVDVIGEIRSL